MISIAGMVAGWYDGTRNDSELGNEEGWYNMGWLRQTIIESLYNIDVWIGRQIDMASAAGRTNERTNTILFHLGFDFFDFSTV